MPSGPNLQLTRKSPPPQSSAPFPPVRTFSTASSTRCSARTAGCGISPCKSSRILQPLLEGCNIHGGESSRCRKPLKDSLSTGRVSGPAVMFDKIVTFGFPRADCSFAAAFISNSAQVLWVMRFLYFKLHRQRLFSLLTQLPSS